ncbi:MAG: hypothetical protein ACI4D8_00935 [Wujia sp.]
MGIKVNKENLLFLAFFLITLGNAQVMIHLGVNKIIIYAGLFLLMAGAFFSWIKIGDPYLRRRMLVTLIVVTVLMSYGICMQDLTVGKKISLILSVFMLSFIACMSRNLAVNYVSILKCSLGIFTATLVTVIISFLDSGIYWQLGDGDGFTAGTEHKNYLAASLVAVIIGCAIYQRYEKLSKPLVIVELVSLICLLFTSSNGGLLIFGLFVVIYSLTWIKKFSKQYRWLWVIGVLVAVGIVGYSLYMAIAADSTTFASRADGLSGYIKRNSSDRIHMWYGYAEKAYGEDVDYVEAARALTGWKGTPEMAILGSLIKSGILGLIGHGIILLLYIYGILRLKNGDRRLVAFSILLPFIMSIFVETYMVNLNLAFGPFCYICIAGLIGVDRDGSYNTGEL